jgi:hypothetical protein
VGVLAAVAVELEEVEAREQAGGESGRPWCSRILLALDSKRSPYSQMGMLSRPHSTHSQRTALRLDLNVSTPQVKSDERSEIRWKRALTRARHTRAECTCCWWCRRRHPRRRCNLLRHA